MLNYAFETLEFHRIEADVDPRNAASIRTLERLGFQREGYLRERWQVNGEIQDSLLYGLAAPGLENRKRRCLTTTMPDLLVNLLKLPPLNAAVSKLNEAGVVIRRAQPFEITPVREFIATNFSAAWADEVSVGLPISRFPFLWRR